MHRLSGSSTGSTDYRIASRCRAVTVTFCIQVTSYALQVEPDRFKRQDTAVLDYGEALRIEKTSDAVFGQLRKQFRVVFRSIES